MAHKSLPKQEKSELNGAIANTPAIIPQEFEFKADLPATSTPLVSETKAKWLTPALLGMGFGAALSIVGMGVLSSQNTKKVVAPVEAPASMTVTIAPVETTSFNRTLEATGTVAAYNLLPVLPQATGLQIKQVLTEEGQQVKIGQILAVLDNAILQNQLSSAQAQLEASKAVVQQKQAALGQVEADLVRAQATLLQAQADQGKSTANLSDTRTRLADAERTRNRYEYLAKQGAISRQDLDTRVTSAASAQEAVRVAQASINSSQANIEIAKAGVKSAQANINSAKANLLSAQADVRNNEAKVQQIQTQLKQTQVLAPASGIIVAPNSDGRCDGSAASGGTTASQSIAAAIARVGDTSGNKALFCIIRNGFLELQVKVPETELNQVQIGANATLRSNSNSNIKLEGKVREIAPMIDPQTRQATVKIDLHDGYSLKPGMFLKAAIATTTAQALAVPAQAVQPQSDGKSTVYLIDNNQIVHAEPVEVGTTIGGDTDNNYLAKVEIKSGLKESDRVVVAGAGYLKDGDKVKVVSNSQTSQEGEGEKLTTNN